MISGVIRESKARGKRFAVVKDGKTINFGAAGGKTFLDHHDTRLRDAWYARHSKIMRKGRRAIDDPDSPAYYSARILWPKK